MTAAAIVPMHAHPWKDSETRVLQFFCRWQTQQEDGGTNEKRSATCLRRNSCARDHLFRHQNKEWRKLEKLALGLPLFSAQFRHS